MPRARGALLQAKITLRPMAPPRPVSCQFHVLTKQNELLIRLDDVLLSMVYDVCPDFLERQTVDIWGFVGHTT